jgi:transketolase
VRLVNSKLDERCINALRFLAADIAQLTTSDQLTLPFGSAVMVYTLWDRFLRFNPQDPHWLNRDRFVLSSGSDTALLYGLLYLTGYSLPIEELKHFRHWGRLTPGHPGYGNIPGVEAVPDPAGQGFASAVGMAVAEATLAACFNQPQLAIVDHYTYVLASDDDLTAGIALAAAAVAGELKLGKLIVLSAVKPMPDKGTSGEAEPGHFAMSGWHVQQIQNGDQIPPIETALRIAQQEVNRPSLLQVAIPNGRDNGYRPYSGATPDEWEGEQETSLARRQFGRPRQQTFHIPRQVLNHFRNRAVERGIVWQAEWDVSVESYTARHPQLAAAFDQAIQCKPVTGKGVQLPAFTVDQRPMATLAASEQILQAFKTHRADLVDCLLDLAPGLATGRPAKVEHYQLDVRSRAVGAILKGMARHGGIVSCGTG